MVRWQRLVVMAVFLAYNSFHFLCGMNTQLPSAWIVINDGLCKRLYACRV